MSVTIKQPATLLFSVSLGSFPLAANSFTMLNVE